MKKDTGSDWVSLKDAASILGVHPTTVRNWADRGDLSSRRTPGGHRRFNRSDLQQWVATQQTNAPAAEAQLITDTVMGRTHLTMTDGNLSALLLWYKIIDDEAKEKLRTSGRHFLELLQKYLTELPDSEATLGEAYEMAASHAKILISQNLTLTQALEGFLFFCDFLHEAALSVTEISGGRNMLEPSSLVRRVRKFTNILLMSMAEQYQAHM